MFEFDLGQELYIFLISINQGLIIGLIYDFYRVLRQQFKPEGLRSLLEDLIFWIIITGVFFVFIFKNTGGIIRSFIVLGFLIGYTIYSKLISKYNFPILNKTFKLILGLINEIIKIITYPIRRVRKYIRAKGKRWMGLVKEVFQQMKRYKKIISKKK